MHRLASHQLLVLLALAVLVQTAAAGRKAGAHHRKPPAPKEAPEATDAQSPWTQSDESGAETCEVARLKCAYRVGCGMALQVDPSSFLFQFSQ